MKELDIYWWTIQIMKPILAVSASLTLTKFLLPLKRGWREENQKLVTKGMVLLIAGLASIALFIYCIKVG